MGAYEKRKNPLVSILIWLMVLAAISGAAYQWGEDIIRYATGQDILEELDREMAAIPPQPTIVPVVQTGVPASTDPTAPEEPIEVIGFPDQPRQHVLKYIIQPGDALFLIAQRFGIHPNTIFWANTDTLQDNVHLLHVGMELYILPVNGVYHKADGRQSIAEIAAQYGVTAGDVLYSEYNALAEHNSAYVPPDEMRIVIPGGRREYLSWQAPIQTGTDSGDASPESGNHPGACRERYSGTGGEGNYANPMGAAPYRVTSLFEPWHPGIDFATDPDTPIYASETGVVVFAGWHRNGYGELIILDHGEGWTTYYAHLSKRFVSCGDQVSKGQYIAGMGMTGNATGFHLHFEIRQDDTPLNPYNFIEIKDERDSSGN